MLKRRIIPCLDVANGKVVKGVAFRQHEVVGDILSLANNYVQTGADELVFYDILASCQSRCVDLYWIEQLAASLTVPFCVAGGITSIADAEKIFAAGADKISINSPALANPSLITAFAKRFGSQSIVVGVDSYATDGIYRVRQLTGDPTMMSETGRETLPWVREVVDRGAGEVVVNCMNQDGKRQGYDIEQLSLIASSIDIPIIASGGAGSIQDFITLFQQSAVSGALAASVFHKRVFTIPELKKQLTAAMIEVRR